MLEIFGKFFDFCGEVNKREFYKSLVLSAVYALMEAMKIPAIMLLIRGALENNVTPRLLWECFVIILDEATANVDPENERELMEAVDALTKEKTIVIIDAFYCTGTMEISPVWSVSSMPARGPSRYSTIRPPSSSISRASASVLRES